MAYSRSEMDGMWSSQDVLKVVPNPEKIPPGYLYAFLGTKFGVPLVVSGTYGAIIQHIEPEHIADLPVPRLGKKLEEQVHVLVQEAANLRTESNAILRRAIGDVCKLWGHKDSSVMEAFRHPDVQTVTGEAVRTHMRFDAFFHSSPAIRSDQLLHDISARHEMKSVGEVTTEVFETTRCPFRKFFGSRK
jgi:type I restriction enzyme S subunit